VSDELKPFVELLTKWDCALSRDSAAAVLYEMWQPKLAPAVFKSHVPEKFWPLIAGRVSLEKTIRALKNPQPRWFGDNASSGRDAALLKTLSEAVAEAKSKLGPDPSRWRWGALHTASFRHQLSTTDARRAVFDLPSVERGGDSNTVFATGGPNFRQTHGASFREILDLADWDASVATSVPGQSGQPQSPHYGDLLPLWAEGKYFPLLYSRAKIEAQARERLTLEPARQP
jgi:penicillin amidase